MRERTTFTLSFLASGSRESQHINNLWHNLLLELRKHWRELFGILLTIVLVLLFSSTGYSIVTGYPFVSALWGVSAFLVLAGLPLSALVLGGAFATGLVRANERASEEMLPISPSQKLFSSYFGSLFYFGFIMLVFYFLLLWTKTPTLILDAFDFDRLVVLLLPLHCFAFIFCYWLKQPVLGSGLALIFTAIQYFAQTLLPADVNASSRVLDVIFMLFFQLLIFRPLARKIERSGQTGILTGFFLLIPLLVSCISPQLFSVFTVFASQKSIL